MFSNLASIISTVSIPMEITQDNLIWKHSDNGDLELKHAYDFKLAQVQELHWARLIWNVDIPPSKSLLAWRLMHDKLPTDDNLMTRGCSIPSMCNFCLKHTETSFHIFFECQFAIKLWSWLAGCLNFTLQFTSMEDIWKLCDLNWSPQSKVTMLAAIINLLLSLMELHLGIRVRLLVEAFFVIMSQSLFMVLLSLLETLLLTLLR
jgi:hypothetical protein